MRCKILVYFAGLIVCASALAQTNYRVRLLGGREPLGTWGYAIDGNQAGGFTTLASARLWNIQTGKFLDLNPPGYEGAGIRAIGDGMQLGWRSIARNFSNHLACFWRGTPESCVDLHPQGFTYSEALGGDSNLQVGWGLLVDERYVGLAWRGTKQSAIIMLPTGYASSFCWSTESGKIVGNASSYSAPSGAALWSSTDPDDFVILPTVGPYPYDGSIATDIRGEFIVGDASLASYPNPFHAAAWTSSKHVFHDLHPPGWEYSSISATNGVQHVGTGTPDRNSSVTHALVWTGTSRQALDLHEFLPPGLFWGSEAWGINKDGVIVGEAYGQSGDYSVTAVIWIPEKQK